MKKKLIFIAGAMIIAAAVSATVYVNRSADRNDLFEQNLEALADGENVTGKYKRETFSCSIYVGANGKIKIGGVEIQAGADGYISVDGGVACANGGEYLCRSVECTDVYQTIFN